MTSSGKCAHPAFLSHGGEFLGANASGAVASGERAGASYHFVFGTHFASFGSDMYAGVMIATPYSLNKSRIL